MKKILLLILITSIFILTQAQIVNIPDANFKAYLVGESAINTNNDTEIQVAEAQVFTGQMKPRLKIYPILLVLKLLLISLIWILKAII